MSWQSVRSVLQHSRSKGSARLVLIVVAEHADNDGTKSFPSLNMLMNEACLSERAVWYALKQLVDMGELVLSGHGYTATVDHPYSICLSVENPSKKADPVVEKEGMASANPAVKSANHALELESAKFAAVQNVQPTVQTLHPPSAEYADESAKFALALIGVNHQLTTNEPPVNHPPVRAREGAGESASLSALIARASPVGEWDGPDTFAEFWRLFWQGYPKQGRVDKLEAEAVARNEIHPSAWGRVLRAEEHYCQSDIVRRGKVRNAANWLSGESWCPYEDGPLLDAPPTPPTTIATARELKSKGMHSVIEEASKVRAHFEGAPRRVNGHG